MRRQLDFQHIADELLGRAVHLLEAWLPGGKLHGKEYKIGDLSGTPGESLSINTQTGAWSDFESGHKGGDLISLYAAIKGLKQGEAARELAKEIGIEFDVSKSKENGSRAKTQSNLAPPPPGEIPLCRHPVHGRPSMTWTYRSFDGQTLFLISRHDHENGKEFLPWSWDTFQKKWVNKAWPAPRPLFNLDKLAKAEHNRVLLVEGEKACLAAEVLIGGKYTVMTWPNGSNSWSKADWSPIHGKDILVWPDADDAGRRCAQSIAAFLVKHCPLVKVIDVSDHADGWDAADAIKEGWDTAKFVDWAKARVATIKPEEPQPSQEKKQKESFVSDEEERITEEAERDSSTGKGKAHIYESLLQPINKLNAADIDDIANDIISPFFRRHFNPKTSLYFRILNNDTHEVELCTNEDFLKMHVAKEVREKYSVTLKVGDVEKIIDMWKLYGPNLSVEPTPFAWPSEEVWTFKKLAFEPTEGKFDSWVEFLLRLSSPEDFMAFVWSIFEKQNRSRQFLYLHDSAGQGGKSTVIGVLGDIFGGAFASINNSFVGGGGGRWLMGHLYGKRFAAWADCKNPKFCMSEIVRNITSGDSVPIEFKGEQTFNAPMYVKLIIGSNYAPEITGTAADKSRLIRIDVKRNEVSHNDPHWAERLRAELPHFLWECKQYYDRQCANNGNIKLQTATIDHIDQSTESTEVHFEDIAHRRFLFDPAHKCSTTEWLSVLREEGLSNQRIGDFQAYLSRCYPHVIWARGRKKNIREKFYKGFTARFGSTQFDGV